MDEERLKAVIESLLFAAGEPLSLARIAAVLEGVPRDEIRKALGELTADFHRQGRGIVLAEVAGGYQLRTVQENALYVRKLLAARPARLSRAMMEVMAIIAYRQPITRPEIEQLRGVDSGAVLENLLERRLVKIAGRKEAPGRPQIYVTTAEFLETFGLKDLDSLPDLGELREIEQRIEAAEQQRLQGETQEQEELNLPPAPGAEDRGIAAPAEVQGVNERAAEIPPEHNREERAGDNRAPEPAEISHADSEQRADEGAASGQSRGRSDSEPRSSD